jgi:hypothetical protein
MSFVTTQPEVLAAAAGTLQGIGSAGGSAVGASSPNTVVIQISTIGG